MSTSVIQVKETCTTCNHSIEVLSKQSKCRVCSFCQTINWNSSVVDPWKKVSGTALNLISVLKIGSTLNNPQIKGKIIGCIEWHLTNGPVLFWNILDEYNNIHYLSEDAGLFFLYKNAANSYKENQSIINPKPGKPIKFSNVESLQNYHLKSILAGKRYDIFGEVFFPADTDPMAKHLLAYNTEGNSLLILQFNKIKNQIWQGEKLTLEMEHIINPNLTLFE